MENSAGAGIESRLGPSRFLNPPALDAHGGRGVRGVRGARHPASSPGRQLGFTGQPTSHFAGELGIVLEGVGLLDGLAIWCNGPLAARQDLWAISGADSPSADRCITHVWRSEAAIRWGQTPCFDLADHLQNGRCVSCLIPAPPPGGSAQRFWMRPRAHRHVESPVRIRIAGSGGVAPARWSVLFAEGSGFSCEPSAFSQW